MPVTKLSRRDFFVAGAGLGMSFNAALAQTSWWEALSASQPSPPPSHQSKKSEVNDLKNDTVPWRSNEMLDLLDAAIERIETLAAGGPCEQVANGPALRISDDDERVVALKVRLGRAGLLRGTPGYFSSSSFDDRLENAINSFQKQSGLRTTGWLDRTTLAQLNVSPTVRLAQLRLNRRRVEELLRGPVEDRHVFVNAAAYQLEAVERYEVHRRHRVIVGKPDRQTPEIKASIRALNFFRSWHVPDSVARLDLIPRLRKEPGYLDTEKIRAFSSTGALLNRETVDWSAADASQIRFRQDPGSRNALGLVRIDMPNDDIVYMHDTPMKQLFDQQQRAFSAGCVRVQEVFELATWIAALENGWQEPGGVQRILDGGQSQTVKLARQIPVYFSYLTAWAEGDGMAVFRPDIYGRDGQHVADHGLYSATVLPPQGLAP